MTQQLSQERFLSNTYSFTCNMQYCQACEMYICVPLHGKNIFWMFWDLQDQKQASYKADGQLHGWLDWKGCTEWQEQAARQNRQIKIYIGQKKTDTYYNSPLNKLWGEWVQALSTMISGIIWVDKHFLRLVKAWFHTYNYAVFWLKKAYS